MHDLSDAIITASESFRQDHTSFESITSVPCSEIEQDISSSLHRLWLVTTCMQHCRGARAIFRRCSGADHPGTTPGGPEPGGA